jgi:hypothetical protein
LRRNVLQVYDGGLNNSKQARPKLGHQNEKKAVAVPEPEPRLCATQSDIELMPKKQILGFKSAARLEQAANEQCERTEDRNHRRQGCDDSRS